jgi:hypothetical protein
LSFVVERAIEYFIDSEGRTLLLLDKVDQLKPQLIEFLSKTMSGDNVLNYQGRHLNEDVLKWMKIDDRLRSINLSHNNFKKLDFLSAPKLL